MLLDTDIKTIANYAERRTMWITPNEAKRLGVKGCHSSIRHSIGMYRLVEWNKVSQKRHPVRDASLTGCKGKAFGHFLPSKAFLTECSFRNINCHSSFFNLLKYGDGKVCKQIVDFIFQK